jgi:hypothetical protein
MKPLYHATLKEYKRGERVTLENEVAPFTRELDDNKKEVYWEFERLRPAKAKSRKRGFFACSELPFCSFDFAVANKVDPLPSRRFYVVEMPSPSAVPIVLVNIAYRASEDQRTKVITEYWSPTEEWQFLEYIDDEMTIIHEIAPSSSDMVRGAKWLYQLDYDKARILFLANKKNM